MNGAPIPCRICGCLDGEPGLCHAVTKSGKACFRPAGYPDWCSACSTWDKSTRLHLPSNTPLEALACLHRATRANDAAAKRGLNVPGSYALRVHAARMNRKFNTFMIASGIASAPEAAPVKEKDRPICPASL